MAPFILFFKDNNEHRNSLQENPKPFIKIPKLSGQGVVPVEF